VEVGLYHLAPLFRRHAVEHGVARDAGVVDEHFDGPEVSLDFRDAFLAGVIVGDRPLVDRNARIGAELLRGFFIAGIVGGDLVARILQSDRDRSADAARSAGDECHSCHEIPPVVRRAPVVFPSTDRSQPTQFNPSTVIATPMPPPMHSVARPFFAPRRFIANSSVLRMRAPEAPIGWPMAVAPPLTFTISGFQPMSLLTAQAC